jgi:hypothetical protein
MNPRGGFSVAEYSTNSSLSTVKEITKELKEGTGIEPSTPTEEFTDGTDGGAGKDYTFNIRSAELAADVYADLKTAELNETDIYFRLIGLDTEQIIEDCEDAWNEFVGANVTSTQELTDKKVGIASAKINVAVDAGVGILATEAISPAINLSARKEVSLWIKNSVQLAAGDLQLLLDNSPNCATPLETLNIPALAAAIWTKVNLTLSNPAALTAVASVGLKMVVDKGAFIVYLDDIRAVTMNWVLKKAKVTHVDDPKAKGAFHAKKIVAKASGATEADVLVFTP